MNHRGVILLLDNYDSFVWNLDCYLQRLGVSTLVVRSDAISVDSIRQADFAAIVISPGPKWPDQAGVSLEAVRRLYKRLPILGVCLGHQAIVQAFGGQIIRGPAPCHGRASEITFEPSGLYTGITSPQPVARYHSLVAEPSSLPDCLRVTASTADGVIMSVEHRQHPVFGVQYHPESILSPCGLQVVANFLALAGVSHERPAQSSPIGVCR